MDILDEVRGEAGREGRPGEVFAAFGRLGLTAFGGPIAHLSYFRDEFVLRRRWLDERAYADLVALCQFLPGPTSSQVGFAIGLRRAGWAGASLAFLAFTLPSALLLFLFAQGAPRLDHPLAAGAIDGLKIAAVAVVAHAVLGMGRALCPDGPRAGVMLGALALVTALPGAFGQVAGIAFGALAGLLALSPTPAAPAGRPAGASISRRAGLAALALFAALLLLLPALAATGSFPLRFADGFFRAGALVFGGGHVVLPLLEAETVARGWLSPDLFLAGYGAAQAVPGPLFTFAAFLGAAIAPGADGAALAALGLLMVFLPGFLLLVAALPFAERLAANPRASRALAGANAAVVGLLLAALYDPIATSAVASRMDFLLAVAGTLALVLWRAPPLAVVAALAVAGALRASVGA